MAGRIATPQKIKRPRQSFQEWMRNRFTDYERYLILYLISGAVCGLVAVLFHVSIDKVFHFAWGFTQRFNTPAGYAMLVAMPALGGLVTGIIIDKLSPTSAGSGIPQTKMRYYRDFGVFRLREALYRFLLGIVSIGLGMSLGREGPTVHICAAISSKIGQMFGLAKKRVQAMVPVGMGAGIAAAFNTPIAAMFFVYEELLEDFSTKALFGILVAVVVASAVERIVLGEHPAFPLGELPMFTTHWWMLVCIPLGITAALLGHLFVGALLETRARFKQMKHIPAWIKPSVGGLLVGLIGVSVLVLTDGRNGVFGIGYNDLASALNGELVLLGVLLALFVGKFSATIFAYASGGSGGLFAPSLFIGGMLGAIFGCLLQIIFGLEDHIVGATALLGMGAFFAAVIRCPLTSIMIIFELTRNYAVILPLMAGNILAYLLASKLRSVALYDALLLQDKISLRKLPTYKGEQDWRNLPVSTIMTFDPVTLSSELCAAANLSMLGTVKHHAYPVVDARKELSGMITHHELEEFSRNTESDPKALKEYLKEQEIVALIPETSIRDAANTLVLEDVLQAPVVSKAEPKKLLGIVTLHDIARQQNAIEDAIGR